MTTATAERTELYRVIDTLPDDSVVAMLGFLKSLRQLPEDDDGFYDPANVQWLRNSIARMAQGKTVTKTIEELERIDTAVFV
jgi:hypothetical protein